MFKRVVLTIGFVLSAFAVASLYVGGVASFTDSVVRFFRPGPKLAPTGTTAVDDWELFAETAHFRYYVRPGDHIPRWAMDLAEEHLDAACAALEVTPPAAIQFYKHSSQLDLHEATGSRSTGTVFTSEDGQRQELHSVHRYDPHEVMHALAHETMGEPPAIFDEGLATAFGWDWTPGERDVHARARVLLKQGRVVPLKRLLTNWDFRSYKSYPAYTAAGSFIKYLLAEYGPHELSKLFELDKYSQRDMIEEAFAAAYGRDIYQVEESWRAALQSGILLATPRRPAPQSSNTSLAVTGIILLAATFVGAVLFIVAGEKAADAVIQRLRSLAGMVSRRLGFRHPE
jgi:hypothetical protein